MVSKGSNKKDYTHLVLIIKWTIRGLIPFCELAIITMIILLLFNGQNLDKEMQNIMSALVGGLLVNLTKSVGWVFSREADEK
jgi:branched-subunit amino acid transport protein